MKKQRAIDSVQKLLKTNLPPLPPDEPLPNTVKQINVPNIISEKILPEPAILVQPPNDVKKITIEPIQPSTLSHTIGDKQLSPEQQVAYEKFKRGENLFITGPGGTGKTLLIQHLVRYANSIGKNVKLLRLLVVRHFF
jgi:Cdc6-like AAA superfamily ATPase